MRSPNLKPKNPYAFFACIICLIFYVVELILILIIKDEAFRYEMHTWLTIVRGVVLVLGVVFQRLFQK